MPPIAYILGLTNSGLAVIRSLARARVPLVGVDHWRNTVGFASRLCTPRVCPPPEQPDEVLRFLIAEGERLDAPATILLAKDFFALLVSRHRTELSRYFRFVLPAASVSEAMVDKQAQYALAKSLGLPYPAIHNVSSMEDLERLQHAIEFPVLIKPQHAHLWQQQYPTVKLFKVFDSDQLRARCQEVLPTGLSVLLQAFVPGPASNLRIWCGYISQEGEVLGSYVVQKIRQYPPEFGEAAFAVTVKDVEIEELGKRFALGVAFRGPCMVEFKRDDRNGEWKLMELNPRFWSHTSLGSAAGVDLPLLNYLDAAGEKPPPCSGFTPDIYWLHTKRDIRWFVDYGWRHDSSVTKWLWSWTKAGAHATFAWNDLAPLFRQAMNPIARATRARVSGWPVLKRLLKPEPGGAR